MGVGASQTQAAPKEKRNMWFVLTSDGTKSLTRPTRPPGAQENQRLTRGQGSVYVTLKVVGCPKIFHTLFGWTLAAVEQGGVTDRLLQDHNTNMRLEMPGTAGGPTTWQLASQRFPPKNNNMIRRDTHSAERPLKDRGHNATRKRPTLSTRHRQASQKALRKACSTTPDLKREQGSGSTQPSFPHLGRCEAAGETNEAG